LLRFEPPAPLGYFLRDLLATAAEERADRNAESSFVGKAGFKRRRALPGFIARHLHARRGAEEVGKPRLREVGVPAITAEVVIEGPSVKMCHGNTKDRRREKRRLRRGGKRPETNYERSVSLPHTDHDLKQMHVNIIR
jgi:hypothetical protein